MRLILIFLLFNLTNVTNAQTPNWLWAENIGTPGVGSNGLTTDAFGHLYVTGVFRDTSVLFGNIRIPTSGLLFNAGPATDMFITKYDVNGNVLWAKSAGNSTLATGNGICADVSGNIFVTGDFSDSIRLGDTLLTSIATEELFLAKYDSLGNILWARSPAGSSLDASISSNTICLDNDGNILVAGSFLDSVLIFGNDTLRGLEGGVSAIFIVKYNNVGEVIWAKSAVELPFQYGSSISALNADQEGNVFVTGSYFATIIFGNDTLFHSTSNFNPQVFIAKYDASGHELWAKSPEDSNSNVTAVGVCADSTGNVYINGSAGGDSILFDNINLHTSGFYLAKYDGAGNALWAKGSNGNCAGSGMAKDADGNILGTGLISDTSITFESSTLNAPSGNGLFIVKYDEQGNVIWAKSAEGEIDPYVVQHSISLGTDAGQNIYVTANTQSAQTVFDQDTLISNGAFLAKLSNTTTGISVVNTEQILNVFPNPSTGNWQLSSTSELIGSTIEIFASNGQLIYKSKISNQQTQISIPYAASGIYQMQIISEEYSTVRKLVKL